ncbi:hypothetical protein FEM48_Zijuj01G0238500 [Ziziphus jujuba var. spinosa]|uniref:Uncharacterized protein n=2 Tax=Ziziphus jujuba TaxID=326968 RepID=A0A978W4A5_ZIZJJ|nr:hypothetical protein FEM48_Zijuj01G0238500 [Ziziphus jujuba var. spinosa]
MKNIQKLVIKFMVFICITLYNYFGIGHGEEIFNVLDYGAVGDGNQDDSQAFLKAWEAVCGQGESSATLVIPAGKTFLLQPTDFAGPCKTNSPHVQVLGKIVAPADPNAWKKCGGFWLSFLRIQNLIMDGSGEIDGQGSSWWNGEQTKCQRPIAVQFNKCNNLQLSGLTHLNPPNAHIQIFGTRSAYLTNLHINAPKDSPNTDGIKIGGSTHVQIHDSVIATGDDCIALLNGSNYINITNIACGPGHGISVGSLGGHGGYSVVEGVRVYNCSFNGTMNGARIKTFQGGQGYARKIHFDKITLIAAQNPIIIDQNYNVLDDSNINQETSVEVSDVTYSGFEGTSADEKAITIACSASPGCLNITMYGNNITSSVPGKDIYASCNNAKGTSKDTMPMVPCLSNNSNVQL